MAVIPINSQRVTILDVVEQAEKRIAQREIITLAEKVQSPRAVQVLFNGDVSIACFNANVTAAPVQTRNCFRRKIFILVNARRLNRIAVEPRLDLGKIVRINQKEFLLHVEIVDTVLLQLFDLRQ